MKIDIVPDLAMRGHDDPHGRGQAGSRPPTVGQLAWRLRALAERPAEWWPLVRFDPTRPTRTRLDHVATTRLWLMAWPPGHRAAPAADGGAEVSTLIAGELREVTIGPSGVAERTLHAGRVRVRGAATPPRQAPELHNPGFTYAITLHAARG
ncbi:MAG TPA: cysteine dioxygenase [Streptosporangiaceae bacterium]